MLDPEGPRLIRRLGLVETTAVAIGSMIGAGVYVSMGVAAGTTGGSLLLALLLGGAVATLNGLSAVELGVDDPHAGGAYRFGRLLVSPVVGFVAGWLALVSSLTAGATFALTFAAYVEPLLPSVPLRLVGLAFLVAAVAVNSLGVRLSARANAVLVTINLMILVTFVVLALSVFDASRLQPFFIYGGGGLLQAGALLFFAYSGYARPVTLVEEVREPRTTLPRAVPAALGITTTLYLAVALAALGALNPVRMGEEGAPLRAAMVATGNPAGPALLSMGALIATSTVLLTDIWGVSRLAFAMAREGDLPEWLGRLSEPQRIPRNAVLTAGALLLVLAGVLDLRPALEASSLALLIYYGIMNVSAMRLPPQRRLYPAGIPMAGLAGCVMLAVFISWPTLLAVLGIALVGLAYYLLRHRRHP